MRGNLHLSRSFRAVLAQCGALYFVLSLASIYLTRQPGNIATLWFSNALAVAYLLANPVSRTLALLTVVALANFCANLLFGDAFALAVAFVLPNLAEMMLAVFLVRITLVEAKFSESPQNYFGFIVLACFIPPLFGAACGATLVAAQGLASFSKIFTGWYLGSAVGSVGMLPLALLLLRRGAPFFSVDEWKRVMLFAVLTLTTCLLVLNYLPFPFIYITVPLSMAAVRLSFRATAGLVFIAAVAMGVVASA